MRSWIYFLLPPRTGFAATMTSEEDTAHAVRASDPAIDGDTVPGGAAGDADPTAPRAPLRAAAPAVQPFPR